MLVGMNVDVDVDVEASEGADEPLDSGNRNPIPFDDDEGNDHEN